MSDLRGRGPRAELRQRSVIVNGDDFGLSPEVNAGILRAHREGILTSASLMVAAPARDAAAELAHANPALDVGLHFVVCKGRSVLEAARLAGAVDGAGNFADNPVLSGMRYFFDRRMRDAMRAEARAQIELHLKLVGYLNHIDGHLNFHVHPVLADILVDLAVEYRVPFLRLPRERVFTTLRLKRDHAPRKLVEAVIFRSLSRRMRRLMAARGLKSTDWLFGLHQSGNMSESYLRGVIERLPAGLTELYFHPAADVGATPPSAPSQLEVRLLSDPAMRDALAARRIALTSFAQLARESSAARKENNDGRGEDPLR